MYLSIQSAHSYPKGILVNLIVVLLRLPVMIQNLEWCSEAYQVLGAGSRSQTLILCLLLRLGWQSLTLNTWPDHHFYQIIINHSI